MRLPSLPSTQCDELRGHSSALVAVPAVQRGCVARWRWYACPALPRRKSATNFNFAGTVHAALLGACACITLPALPDESDQLFWAARLHAIGTYSCLSTFDQR
jgi:hypothetical protein